MTVVCEEIPIRRFEKGVVVTRRIMVRFDGGDYATLGIGVGWVRKRTGDKGFERYDVYDVRRLETNLPGRAFSLKRPKHDEDYAVLVADDRSLSVCSCRGFLAADGNGLVCKHLAALIYLVDALAVG